MAGKAGPDEVRDGVGLTNLDKPLFGGSPDPKRALVDYLDAMSDRLLPALSGRPLSVIRVLRGQDAFMQKNVPKYTPDFVRTVSYWAERSKREVTYALCDDRRTLLWFANQRAIEYHVALFRSGQDGDAPTHLVLDIDPPEGEDFTIVIRAARLVQQALADSGLAGALKTSGAKGVHIFVPIVPTEVEVVAAATRALAARAERLDPELATTAFVVEDRHGKVFLDATRAGGATVVSAYSPRLRDGLPVSYPLEWADLDAARPAHFTVHNAVGRLAGSDPWSELMPAPQSLPDDLVEHGRTIPIARVQAMHAGKRRAEARRRAERTDDPSGS